MKPFQVLALLIFGFAGGILVRDQKDDERIAACEQNRERASKFTELVTECFNEGSLTDGADVFACKRNRK